MENLKREVIILVGLAAIGVLISATHHPASAQPPPPLAGQHSVTVTNIPLLGGRIRCIAQGMEQDV